MQPQATEEVARGLLQSSIPDNLSTQRRTFIVKYERREQHDLLLCSLLVAVSLPISTAAAGDAQQEEEQRQLSLCLLLHLLMEFHSIR